MQNRKSFIILVVDDEPPICDLLTRISHSQFSEAQFINIRSTEETFEYLNNSNKWPNLILLDIDLSQNINGLEFLPQLRETLEKKVPIVMLTASTDRLDIKQAYEAGAAAYTQKPNSLQEWRDYINMLKTYWYDTNTAP